MTSKKTGKKPGPQNTDRYRGEMDRENHNHFHVPLVNLAVHKKSPTFIEV